MPASSPDRQRHDKQESRHGREDVTEGEPLCDQARFRKAAEKHALRAIGLGHSTPGGLSRQA